MIHFSLPCTGGCSWNHINKDNPGGIERIKDHQRLFKRLFFNATWLIEKIEDICPIITMELPTGTEYWKWNRVKKFLKHNGMEKYSFHGCSFGLRNKKGDFLKKGWTIASNKSEFQVFDQYKCSKDHKHGSSRGKDLKEAESYTFEMTDLMHKTFCDCTPTCSAAACNHHSDDSSHTSLDINPIVHTCAVAMASASANIVAKLSFSDEERRRLNGLADENYDQQYADFWRDEIIETAFHLMRIQTARASEIEDTIEGILAQCRSQVVLETWMPKVVFDPSLHKLTQLSDLALGHLRDVDPLMPLAGGRPMEKKKVWIVVSDSGLVLLSGSKKNRQFYEPIAEFNELKPADVDDITVCLLWGKKLHHLSWKLEELINGAIQQHGRNVDIHAIVYWNGNELVGPDGIEDEPRYPFRPSSLNVGGVYDAMKKRLERLAPIVRRCETFSIVTGPQSWVYDFTTCWDEFFVRFRSWCTELQIQYVDATLVAEHIEKADQYHGRKTVANVSKLTSFFTSLLRFQEQQKKFKQYEVAFDSLINRKMVLTYEDAVEMKDEGHAAAQKQSYLNVKNRVLQKTPSQLGASRMFTREQINEWSPVDEPMTEKEVATMTEGVKVELEHESQVTAPMEVEIDAPRKRQAEGQQPGDVPMKQRAVTFDVPSPAPSSTSLGSTEKAAPTSSKVASAVKTRPDPPNLPRPDPPELPASVAKAVPPPPKGVSAPAPPPKVDYNVDRFEYFDMAITGLPGHYLNIPRNVDAKQEVRISVPNSMQVLPLIPMLGSELKDKPGVSLDKVPKNTKAVKQLSGILRGFMSDALNKKTDYHGYAHLDDVKRELLTGRFKTEIAKWSVETFMSIAAFDDKDRFEVLAGVDLNHSIIASKTVPFKIRCVQGHQEEFLKTRSPTIGALRIFCPDHHRDRYPKRLTEGSLADAPPRLYHRTSSAAAMEIIRHGLIPGGVGASQSGRKHSYLSPSQVGDAAYKSGVRANQPIEVAFDTELALRSGVDLTLTTSDAITTAQHIPNSCILWVKDTKANTFVYSITDADKRKIYEQSMYGDKKAKDVFGSAVAATEAQKEEAPAETPGRDSDVATGTTQVRHIQERVPADDETSTPATVEQRKQAASQPTAYADTTTRAAPRGTIPSGTYVALPESPCPRCTNCLIDGMFSCMVCGYIIFSSKRSERALRVYQQRQTLCRRSVKMPTCVLMPTHS